MCRDGVRRAKDHMELNVVKNVKDNKKVFYGYISSKRESVGLLLKGKEDLVTKDVEEPGQY